MVSGQNPHQPEPAPARRLDIHVHRDAGYPDNAYIDEPTPAEVAAAASFSVIQAVLLVVLVLLVVAVIVTLMGGVSIQDVVDGLRNPGGGTDTPAQPAR